ncbi:conserved hypothetical protein [Rippkaea orientalis PCC 8801]|uniref:Uncharacterized protein n=2 Tax=Rippkaea TaxID=2546365 RepID=B7K3R4_RIPO1|nr:conserved hypothetical protein [Rippkaea orientalis PCC 8801]
MQNIKMVLNRLPINQEQWNPKNFDILLIILGIILPFILVTFLDSYSRYDVGVFEDWASCWGQEIYLECPTTLVYPSGALIFSAGVIQGIKSLLSINDRHTVASVFRYFLAFFDSLNFLLWIYLAKMIHLRLAIVFAFIVLIIPSSWAGSSVWGQIEGISLFFCLASTIFFLKSWTKKQTNSHNKKAWKSGVWLLLGTPLLSIFILTKQWNIFSLPFFLLVFVVTVVQFWTNFGYRCIFWVLSALILLTLSFLYLDSFFLVVREFHHSSYWLIWTGPASNLIKKIAGNGFNIWIFLGRPRGSSSLVPFLTFNIGNWKSSLTPFKTGLFLYSMFIIFLLFTFYRNVLRVLQQNIMNKNLYQLNDYLIAILLFFHGLCHLGFNVLLSGTHERYLYLGYPSLLMAVIWFYTNKIVFSWHSTLLCFLAAFAYGCFVYSRIGNLPKFLILLQKHEFLGGIHFLLLGFLFYLWLQVCKNYKKTLHISPNLD